MRNLSYTKKGPGRRHRGPGYAKRKAEWLKKNAPTANKYETPKATVAGGMLAGMQLYIIEKCEDYKLRLRDGIGHFKRAFGALTKLRSK